MPVPTYDKCMLPLLQFASDKQDHHIREAIETLASFFGLSDAERAEMLPSGTKFKFSDRVQWANTYLKKAGLLTSIRRSTFRITDRGLQVLETNPSYIDKNYLMQFPEFANFQARVPSLAPQEAVLAAIEAERTPQDLLQSSYEALTAELIEDLLEAIMDSSPSFFEKLILDLLLALGYGGAIEGAGEVIGRTGDNGVDVVIKEDKLG
jgi:restriction system protein